MKRTNDIPAMIPCRHCVNGFVENPAYRGSKMREARLKVDLPLREVARRMNYSVAYLSDLELGRRAWDDELIETFNKALRVK